MRKSGKILLGLLTVTALVGTGFAAWTINDKFQSVSLTENGDVDKVINHDQLFDLEVTPTTSIKFDGLSTIKGEIVDNSKLEKKFTLKALPKASGVDVKDIYNPSRYDALAESHRPNIKFKTTVEGTKEHVDLFNQYIVVPQETTISYNDWLKADLSETGYEFATSFTYVQHPGKTGLENHPQKFLTTEAQLNEFFAAVKGVKFTYTFEVGLVEEQKSGAITLPDKEVTPVTVNIDGLDAGTVDTTNPHTISITPDDPASGLKEAYILETSPAGDTTKFDLINNKTVDSGKKGLQTTGKTYTYTYTFKKDYKYSFELVLAKLANAVTDNSEIVIDQEATGQFTGETLKFTVTAPEGKKIKTITRGADDLTGEFAGQTTATITTTLKDGENKIAATFEDIKVESTITLVQVDGATLTINDAKETYYIGDTITLNANVTDTTYEFISFVVDGVEQSENTLVLAKEAYTISVKLAKKASVITTTTTGEGKGTLTVAPETDWKFGDQVTITATAEKGSKLTSLTLDGQEVETGHTFTVSKDAYDIKANFDLIPDDLRTLYFASQEVMDNYSEYGTTAYIQLFDENRQEERAYPGIERTNYELYDEATKTNYSRFDNVNFTKYRYAKIYVGENKPEGAFNKWYQTNEIDFNSLTDGKNLISSAKKSDNDYNGAAFTIGTYVRPDTTPTVEITQDITTERAIFTVKNIGKYTFKEALQIRFQESNTDKSLTLSEFKENDVLMDTKNVEEFQPADDFLGYNLNIELKPGETKTYGAKVSSTTDVTREYTFKTVTSKNQSTTATIKFEIAVKTGTVVISNDNSLGTITGVEASTEYPINEPLNVTISPAEGKIIDTVTFNAENITISEQTTYELTLKEGENTLEVTYKDAPKAEATVEFNIDNPSSISKSEVSEPADGIKHREGDKVTITFTPATKFDHIINVLDANGEEATKVDTNIYEVTLIANLNTISVTVEHEVCIEEIKTQSLNSQVTFDAKVLIAAQDGDSAIFADNTGYIFGYKALYDNKSISVGDNVTVNGKLSSHSNHLQISSSKLKVTSKEVITTPVNYTELTNTMVDGKIDEIISSYTFVKFDGIINKKSSKDVSFKIENSSTTIKADGYEKSSFDNGTKVYVEALVLGKENNDLVIATTKVLERATAIETKQATLVGYVGSTIDLTGNFTVKPTTVSQDLIYELPENITNVNIENNVISLTNEEPTEFDLIVRSSYTTSLTTTVHIKFETKQSATIAWNELGTTAAHITSAPQEQYFSGDIITFTVDDDTTGKATVVKRDGDTDALTPAEDGTYTLVLKAGTNLINISYEENQCLKTSVTFSMTSTSNESSISVKSKYVTLSNDMINSLSSSSLNAPKANTIGIKGGSSNKEWNVTLGFKQNIIISSVKITGYVWSSGDSVNFNVGGTLYNSKAVSTGLDSANLVEIDLAKPLTTNSLIIKPSQRCIIESIEISYTLAK